MLYSFLLIIETKEEADAVERIFQTQYNRMFRAAVSILKNKNDAEDAVMNTFVYIAEHPERFIDFTSPETIGLISVCTKSAAIDIYRRKKRDQKSVVYDEELPDPDPIGFSDLPSFAVQEENWEILVEEIRRLDAADRILLELKYFYHWKLTEIAELTKTSPAVVSKQINKAKVFLAEILRKRGVSV